MVKLPTDVQRTKESSDACQRCSSSQVDVFKAFLHATAGESHDRAARVGIFGGAVQVVDGVLSGGQTGGVLACGEAWSRKKETRLVGAPRGESRERTALTLQPTSGRAPAQSADALGKAALFPVS